MGLLARTDQAAGAIARLATTIGQAALVGLGVHLAADQLDDLVLIAFSAAQGALDAHATGAASALAQFAGQPPDALCFWDGLPLTALAAGFALAIELGTDALLCGQFLLTQRQPELSWSTYRRTLSVHALVMPIALAGVLLAGSWSLAMAAEDLLPASLIAPWTASILGLAALARFGLAAWTRAVAALEPTVPSPSAPPPRSTRGLGAALLLAPIGLLAWMHGVPVWGPLWSVLS